MAYRIVSYRIAIGVLNPSDRPIQMMIMTMVIIKLQISQRSIFKHHRRASRTTLLVRDHVITHLLITYVRKLPAVKRLRRALPYRDTETTVVTAGSD